jgi:acyl-CoA synthetase (AMP-forming)/AMP-acid ligase II
VETRRGVPQYTLDHYELEFADRHLLHGVVERWARAKPESVAILDASTGRSLTWGQLDRDTAALALSLQELGLKKGDFLATALPLTIEHIILAYGCFRIGVIVACLDLRLKEPEIVRSLATIRARAFACLARTPVGEPNGLGGAVRTQCPFVEHLIELGPEGAITPGAVSMDKVTAAGATLRSAPVGGGEGSRDDASFSRASTAVSENDGALVVFTTGSTGYPKPALLSHRNITCQNMCLAGALGLTEASRMLVNLPPSHVGGQTELLMTPLFAGGVAVILPAFDPTSTLRAISAHRVTVLGQIPAMFNLEWRMPDYERYDLSSLELVVYGGQQVPRQFLEKLSVMAPRFCTGLGLTESAGFCTYTAPGASVDEVMASLGHDMPVYPMEIRAPMQPDGTAGEELSRGEIGQVCFRGPQTFLGYVNDLQATARTISRDGYLYTGDLGFADEEGLHFSGRGRWVIKPKGYQVFPGEVEDHFCALSDHVAAAGVVGVEHAVHSEAIVAFIELRPGATLTVAELERHALGIASYMRPAHYVILAAGCLPLNRVAKTDYVALSGLAGTEIDRLRAAGLWDT